MYKVSPRPLMRKVYEEILGGTNIVLAIAPTSYGKTIASPWIWSRVQEDGVAGALIHIAPLRSLVHRIYNELFRKYGGKLQTYGADEEVKSPYFLSDLVVSTLDSFLWNFYRIPVAEAVKVFRGTSMGHYYPAVASILTSIIVFDEAHMYLWEEGGHGGLTTSAVIATASVMTSMNVPVIIETATLNPITIAKVSKFSNTMKTYIAILKAPSNSSSCPYLERITNEVARNPKVKAEYIDDSDWESEKLVRWSTKIAPSWDEVIDKIIDDSSRGPALVITNTVEEALRIYSNVEGKVSKAVLLHGRLSEKDRRRGEESLRSIEAGNGVIVTTQIAEAGVDINGLVLYSGAAPLENLAQRAGRTCRRGDILSECRAEGGRVVIIKESSLGPYSNATVNDSLSLITTFKERIDWRATCNHDDYVSYATLIAHEEPTDMKHLYSGITNLLTHYLRSDARPSILIKLLNRYGVCSLVRSSLMVEVDVGDSIVVASLDWVLRNAGSILKLRNGIPILKVETLDGAFTEITAGNLWRSWRSNSGNCGVLLSSIIKDISNAVGRLGIIKSYRFVAREDSYVSGYGLLLPNERRYIKS